MTMQLREGVKGNQRMVRQVMQGPNELVGAFFCQLGLELRLCTHAPQCVTVQPLEDVAAFQEVGQSRGRHRLLDQFAQARFLQQLLKLPQLAPELSNELLRFLELFLKLFHGFLGLLPLSFSLLLRLPQLLLQLLPQPSQLSFKVSLRFGWHRCYRFWLLLLLGLAGQNHGLRGVDARGALGGLLWQSWSCWQRQLLDRLRQALHLRPGAQGSDALSHLSQEAGELGGHVPISGLQASLQPFHSLFVDDGTAVWNRCRFLDHLGRTSVGQCLDGLQNLAHVRTASGQRLGRSAENWPQVAPNLRGRGLQSRLEQAKLRLSDEGLFLLDRVSGRALLLHRLHPGEEFALRLLQRLDLLEERINLLLLPLLVHVVHLGLAVDLGILFIRVDAKQRLRTSLHLLLIPPRFDLLKAPSRVLLFLVALPELGLGGPKGPGQPAAVSLAVQEVHVVHGEKHCQLLQPLRQVRADLVHPLLGVLFEDVGPLPPLWILKHVHGVCDAMKSKVGELELLPVASMRAQAGHSVTLLRGTSGFCRADAALAGRLAKLSEV
mmetsp:Transcript_57272/g.133940  ORF Transcript_57272/g.133940 Transcript_57272/m.133940 type:complete len:549 (+) Transcript_57272:853-2499(+)